MKYGLIGDALEHSYSPELHLLLWGGEYELHPLRPSELKGFMEAGDFLGINVTIPYKKAVAAYCAELSEGARAVGCVNTVINWQGRLVGYNTDFDGLLYMAGRAGVELAGKNVLILGSGGTSLTAQAVCRAKNAGKITVVSRSGPVNYENVYDLRETNVIINTTPVGMYPDNGGCPIRLQGFKNLSGVLDTVYNPLKTRLVQEAEDLGLPSSGGLIMLTAQAKAAAELFLDRELPEGETERVYSQLLRRRTNIVLTGMPGSGKTVIGREIARLAGRDFADMDEEIEKAAGMTVADIFKSFGEERFRELERETAERLGRETGMVIAAGGGVVKCAANRWALRQNGRVYNVRRSLGELAMAGRPLSASLDALGAMEAERMPLYSALSDGEIENSGSVAQAAGRVMEDFNAYSGDKRA